MKLHASVNGQASYIVAPAGYGKSTLLSQWYQELIEKRVVCAWLNLDKSDDEIDAFFAHLVLALEDANINTGSLKTDAECGFRDMSIASTGSKILNLFEKMTRKTVVVLDDYHSITSNEIKDFILAAQKCGFGMIHFAFAGRDRIGGDSPALIASGNAIVIDVRDLKFSDDEVMSAIGRKIDRETLESLQQKVEGWPFAVQMTRILAQSSNLSSVISTLSGNQGHIAEYLTHQIVKNIPEDLRTFVYKTVLFDKFSIELANEVCGQNTGRELIAKLNMMNSFIVPVDNDNEWFRYHPLFAECLRHLGKQKMPVEVESSYRKAIQWFEVQGYLVESVRYSNMLEDHSLSGDIIKRNGGWAIALSFGVGYLKNILSNIPETEIQKDARLMLAKAYLCFGLGELNKAQSYCRSSELLIGKESVGSDVELDWLCVNGAIVGRSELSNEVVNGTLEDCLIQAKENGNFCYGFIEMIMANEKLRQGEFDASKDYAEGAYLKLQAEPKSAGANYTHLPIAIGAFYTGDFDEARRQFGLVVDTAETNRELHSNSIDLAGVGLNAINYWQGEFKDEEPVTLYESLDSTFQAEGGFDSFTIATDALFHNAVSSKNLEEAQRLIDTLFIVNMRYGISRIEKYCDILQLELCLYRGQLAKAEIYYSKIQKWHSKKDDQSEQCHWYLDISAGYARAQFLAAIGYTTEAISQIDSALEIGEDFGVAPIVLRGEVLKASIFHSIGDISNAKECLGAALAKAAPLQMRRIFTESYIPGQLIGSVREDILESEHSPLLKEFTEQVYLSSQDGLLNDRERDVLIGISNGMTNKEIARMLDLTESTIKFHQRKLYKKFGVSKRVSAVSKARELNMLM
ncbi:MAG: LuxR C-terminal-related transcriptional regulator [Parasphingorhabdus sp.]